MNIYFDIHDNSIMIGKAATKKDPAFFYQMNFDYSLSTSEGKEKAIQEFLLTDESKALVNEPSNLLIISDETVGFGLFSLPKISRFKINDVFETTFKMSFPNFQDYFIDHYEYDKKEEGSTFFYTLSKRKASNDIINIFSKSSISIKGVTYFAQSFAEKYGNLSGYPEATLFIGKESSELIITKGNKVISINIIDYGLNILLGEDSYLDSAYYFENEQAKKYAGFIKETLGTKEVVNDVNIIKTDADKGLRHSKPKELRILKDAPLVNYSRKSNARKLYALVCDIIETYSHDPWFLPIKEVKVKTIVEMFELMNAYAIEEDRVLLVNKEINLVDLIQSDVKASSLFKKSVKTERRKIDWAKFFTMEIGKKKKD